MADLITTMGLTNAEDTFCLGVLEFGGNLAAAYRAAFGTDATSPVANAHLLLGRPEVAKRIRQLTEFVQQGALISLTSHLQELADIRDLAKGSMQLKVALDAEKSRAVAAGVIVQAEDPDKKKAATLVLKIVNSPAGVQAWAQQQGVEPVIIENGSDGRART